MLDDVFVTESLHEERESHYPFGAADRRSVFTPERVTIETNDGTVVEALEQPRASFAGHTLETPWTTLQLAYFVGTAMWTYLTQPFGDDGLIRREDYDVEILGGSMGAHYMSGYTRVAGIRGGEQS